MSLLDRKPYLIFPIVMAVGIAFIIAAVVLGEVVS